MKIGQLCETDFERVYNLFHTVFDRTKWEQDFMSAWSTRNQEASIGAYSEDGKLLAYAIITVKEDSTQIPYRKDSREYWFLEFLAVDPEAQGLGLGTTLLQILLQKNTRIALVPLNNEKLIQWYKKYGFTVISKKKDRWGDPELLMSTLGASP